MQRQAQQRLQALLLRNEIRYVGKSTSASMSKSAFFEIINNISTLFSSRAVV